MHSTALLNYEETNMRCIYQFQKQIYLKSNINLASVLLSTVDTLTPEILNPEAECLLCAKEMDYILFLAAFSEIFSCALCLESWLHILMGKWS